MPSDSPILDGDLLRAFVAFSETLNFTHAARRLHLSQPALFERVKKLSQAIGAPLYEREGREVRLTEVGARTAALGRDMMRQSAQFFDALAGRPSTSITVAAGQGAFLYVLGDAMRAFASESEASIDPITLGGPGAVQAVRAGQADLGVGVFDLVPRGLVARDIVTTPLCAALPARDRLARQETVRLSDLAARRLILAPEGRRQRDLVGRAIASTDMDAGLQTIREPIEADGWELMLAFVRARLGVAVVNGVCRPRRGVVLRPIPELGTVTYRVLRRARRAPSPAADRLEALILEHAPS